jgi:hypothetical protein
MPARLIAMFAFIFGLFTLFCLATQVHDKNSHGIMSGLPDQIFSMDVRDCFNQTLLAATEARFTANLSRSLSNYSTTHTSYLERMTNTKYYIHLVRERFGHRSYGHSRYLAESVTDQTRRSFFFEPEWYQKYAGDVIASLEPNTRFAFFPLSFSLTRFRENTAPTEVVIPR